MNYEPPHYAVSSTLLLLPSSQIQIFIIKILFLITVNMCYSLSMKDQVSHLFGTGGKCMVLCISFVTLLDSRESFDRLWWHVNDSSSSFVVGLYYFRQLRTRLMRISLNIN